MGSKKNFLHSDDLIAEYHNFLLAHKRVSQNTFAAYKRDVDQLVNFLHEKNNSLESCKKPDLVNFLKTLKKIGLSAKTMSRKVSTTKSLFSFLSERFGLQNISQTLVFPKLEQKLPNYLTEREIKRLLIVAGRDQTPKGFRNKVILHLLYASGLRISELVSLQRGDLDFDTGFIRLTGKGSKERMVPLPESTQVLLTYYLDTIHNQLIPKKLQKKKYNHVFISYYNNSINPISRQSCWIMLKNLLRKAGIFKNLSPHSLRHSLATHLLRKGADLRSLQLLLGHENLSTVQIYTHLDQREMRKVYNKKHPRS